jgi:twinkle protein
MYRCEEDAGITYAELGIDLSRYRSGKDFKTFCPQCHHQRKHRQDRSLSVEVEAGHWVCHNPECAWHSGLGVEGRERMRGRTQNVETVTKTGQPDAGTTLIAHPVSPQQSPAPSATPRDLPPELHSWASAWLLEQRGIQHPFAEKFSLRSSEYAHKGTGELKQCIHFPYFVDGRHVNTKHRTLPKSFSQESGTARSLYNIDACEEAGTIIVTEGELDVIACAVAGWEAAVSAPDGAGKSGGAFTAFDEPKAQRLLGEARRIIIATDGDEPGRLYGDALTERFGAHRCWRVEWPTGCKDANDVLVQLGAATLDGLLEHASPVPLPGVRPLSAHRDSVYDLYEHGFAPGISTGWPTFDHLWRPVEGELVIVTGYPGHGKTSWLNHLLVNLSYANDWSVGLYSPEQGSEGEVLGKFAAIAANAPILPTAEKRMTREALDSAIDWIGRRFWEIHAEGSDTQGFSSLTVPQILSHAEPLAMKSNLRLLVIDPWNECESAKPRHMSVEEYISASLSTIRGWCKRNGVICILVIHPRKPDTIKTSEDTAPHPFEAAGAAHWYNKADIFLSVHRVKYGEEAGKTTVAVKKHRREGITGEIGEAAFAFDRRSGRFYCEGTLVPAEIGVDAYIDIPSGLVVPATVGHDTDAWVNPEFEFGLA